MALVYGTVVLFLMVVVYYFLISGKMDKAASAFAAGAILLFLTAVMVNTYPELVPEAIKKINLDELSEFVDFKTLGLLIGMMIILPFIEESGFFQFLAIAVVKLSRGNFRLLFMVTSIIVAISSLLKPSTIVNHLSSLPLVRVRAICRAFIAGLRRKDPA